MVDSMRRTSDNDYGFYMINGFSACSVDGGAIVFSLANLYEHNSIYENRFISYKANDYPSGAGGINLNATRGYIRYVAAIQVEPGEFVRLDDDVEYIVE